MLYIFFPLSLMPPSYAHPGMYTRVSPYPYGVSLPYHLSLSPYLCRKHLHSVSYIPDAVLRTLLTVIYLNT